MRTLPLDPDSVKGFLDPEEGWALHDAALAACSLGPVIEIGAYCGKSAIYIGSACKAAGNTMFSIDHHCGSEENQPGWEWHDAELWDEEAGRLDTLPQFRRTLRLAGLDETVVPMVGRSGQISEFWDRPCGMVFIDGGHSMDAALEDLHGWAGKIARAGTLAIHDVFPDPADGGRAPFEIYRMALASNLFEEVGSVKSLRLLKRL
ncbi:MAG: class I SAM-dependent methyltransferase [Sphingomonadaceae bacterium]|nr:class I SAM-dependent methyltransferase [Sphingomonadaceae bacterium]